MDAGRDPNAESTSWPAGDLLPHHAALIERSGITPTVALARRYRSLTTKADAARLGFGASQRNVPALLIPVWNVAGELATYQLRPDTPRVKAGKSLKYETPFGSRMVLDVPPPVHDRLSDPAVPLVVTEGVRKADASASHGLCCLALLGVWNWRGTNPDGGATALPDWETIALKGRTVYLAFDSDVMVKPSVAAALRRLAAFLGSRGADVKPIYLPPLEGGAKQGLDDFFAAGGTVTGLLGYAADALREAHDGNGEVNAPYAVRDGCICHRKRDRDGDVWVPLCDFSARIVEEVVTDDGASERGELVIAGALADGTPLPPARVPQSQYAGMRWVVPAWGTRAVVNAGFGTADKLREAIQRLSPDAERRREYTHPGWRQIDGGWCYLHAGGAIGAGGPVAGIRVNLGGGPRGRLALPDPAEGDKLREAIFAVLALRDVAPDAITGPLLGSGFRAPLNAAAFADLALFLVGPSGVFKTELAALLMQLFGAGFDRLHLPAGWSATPNALERVAFDYKDAPVVIDDFAPTGSAHDVARYHATADRVLRGAGNAAGRGRMAADGTTRPDYPPRALVVATGEDVPRGHSARARAVVVEVAPGDVDPDRLTSCQEAARAGAYAIATTGYVRWLAGRFDDLRETISADVAELRAEAHRTGSHARTPEAVANLALGWRLWLRYAGDAGALTEVEVGIAWRRAWTALLATGEQQTGHQADQAPAPRFLALLASALASGAAHIAGPDGAEPTDRRAWGWREATVGAGEYQRDEWRPQGVRVGWLDGDDLFLNPEAAHAVAQRAGEAGGGLGVAPKTLAKRLHESGLLRATEQGQEGGGLTVRRQLEGTRRRVLHLAASALDTTQSGQPGQPGYGVTDSAPASVVSTDAGRMPRPDFGADGGASGQETRPGGVTDGTDGRIDRIGRVPPAGQGAATAPVVCALCGEPLPDGGRYLCERCGLAGTDRWTA